jgi:diacylglycerol kinase family enzyme
MKPSTGKAAVVYNASAGRGQGHAIAARSAQFLTRAGWRVIAPVATPACATDRTALVSRLAARVGCLVVVGGDGTLREVCAALPACGHRVTLGLIPIGNANVMARELGIPLDPFKATRLLTNGRPLAVDAGLVIPANRDTSPVLFMAMLEIGFGAAVIHRVHQWRRHAWRQVYHCWGDLLYFQAIIRSLMESQRPAFRARIDSQAPLVGCRQAVIANTSTYARGWTMTPQARPHDGLLDFMGRRRDTPAALVQSYANAWRGRQTRTADVHYRQGRRMIIEAERPLRLQADGDPLPPQTKLRIEVRPKAIQIMAPAGFKR